MRLMSVAPLRRTLCAAFLCAAGASSLTDLSQRRYDVIVVGTGLKESLLAGILAKQGREVLLVEPKSTLGGASKSMDLQQLADSLEGTSAKLSEQRLGDPAAYLIERTPKVGFSQQHAIHNTGFCNRGVATLRRYSLRAAISCRFWLRAAPGST